MSSPPISADAADPEHEGGVVVPFPTPQALTVPEGGRLEPAQPAVEGELITEEEYGRLKRLRQLPARVVTTVREHERTAKVKAASTYRLRKAPRDVGRLTWFALRGHGRWIAKSWTWATHGDLRADARTARIVGNAEARRAAQEAIRADARARWAKLCNVAIPLTVCVTVASVALWVLAGTWLSVVGAVVSWSLVTVVPLGWLVAAAWEGRDRTPGAGFLHRPNRENADSWIDERMISQALAHLGISPLDKYFKAGGLLNYTVAARIDGDGTYAQMRLPMGVTVEMVAARRNTLAANLGRASLETWATKGEEDGILDLWVADKGKLGKGAGEWPLQHDGTVDVFEGVPFGKSQRGEVIDAPLFESNYLIGSRPGQGKSAAMRTLLLGAALDPTAELWMFVMGQSPDFKPFEPRLSRYQMGMDDSVVEAAVQALRDLLKEMERRGKVLEQQPGSPPKVSRKLANKPALGLHSILCGIDECHEMYMHKKFGAEAAELSIKLIKRGRKYGIILILATQSPTKDSISRDVTRNVSCGVAFAVADHVANDGLLGSGKYKAGIRATELRMHKDRGTCVAVGLTDATFELVSGFYVPYEDGIDMVTPVINRAMGEIGELRRTGVRTTQVETAEVDFLADLAEALEGEKQLRTQIVLTRLAEMNPDEYEGWSFGELSATLDEYGIKPRKSDGVMVVRSQDVTGWPTGTGYHLFRHYYASLLIHKGLSVKVVQKRLGHATVKETLDTYGHLWPDSDDDTREAIEATLEPIISGRGASPSEDRKSVARPAQ